MKNFLAMGFVALVLAAGTPGLARCQDEEGCKDHPIVTRMPQFRIASCETKEFEAFEFKVGLDATTGDNKVKVVEVECAGRKVRALVGALDVEPERFDELSRAEKKTASAAFAHAGVKASLVARLVEAL